MVSPKKCGLAHRRMWFAFGDRQIFGDIGNSLGGFGIRPDATHKRVFDRHYSIFSGSRMSFGLLLILHTVVTSVVTRRLNRTDKLSEHRGQLYAMLYAQSTHTPLTGHVSRLSLTSHTQTRRHPPDPRCVCTTPALAAWLSDRLPSLAYALTNTSHNAMQLSTQPLSHTLTPKRKGIYNTQRHVHENGALLFSSSCHR